MDHFPAYCKASNRIVLINRKQPGPSQPPCEGPVVPYSDPSLIRRNGQPLPAGEEPAHLIFGDKVDYFCPATGRFDLHFHRAGLWD